MTKPQDVKFLKAWAAFQIGVTTLAVVGWAVWAVTR